MKIKIRNKETLEIESFRIEIDNNEYLLKEEAEGLKIINIDNQITLRPDVANAIVLISKL